MTQSGNMIGAQPSVWTVGSLSADELERLAGEIRPAWEIGLDAVNDGASAVVAAAIVPSSTGFAAAPATLANSLGSMSGGTQSASVNVAIATAVPQAGVPPRSAPPPPPPARVVPPSNAFASQPVQANARPWEDAVAPASKPKGLLFGGIAAGIAAVGLIAFFALRGGDSATPSTAAPATSVAPETTASVPAVPVAAPAAAPAPAPVVAPSVAAARVAAASPTPVAPSAEAPMAAEPPADAPSSHHGRHVAAAPPPPRVAAHPTVAAAPAPHHHAATASHGARRMRGAGFVTDSPY